MTLFTVAGWWLACSGPPVLEGGCEGEPDNALRARCAFAVEPPGPIEVTVEGPDGEVVAASTGVGELSVWRLTAETTYRFRARAGDTTLAGAFSTPALPAALALAVEHDGDPLPDDVMFLVDCGEPAAVVLDPAGTVVWYQQVAADLPAPHDIVGLTWTPEQTLLVVVDRSRVREYALDGTLVRDLVAPPDRIVHHDAFRRAGWTFVLRARLTEVDGVRYLVDGVLGYDPQDALAFDLDLADLATPSGPGGAGAVYWAREFPGVADWAHANGLFVDEDLDLLVSLHSFSTVLRWVGDPDDAAFGSVRWALAGTGTSPFGSDFVILDASGQPAERGFSGQHHPSLLEDGSLLLFDNGAGFTEPSRVLKLGLDEARGTAEVLGSWPMELVCPIEGGAFRLSSGDLLGTCSLQSTYLVLDEATGERRSRTQARCEAPSGLSLLPRAIPVSLESVTERRGK